MKRDDIDFWALSEMPGVYLFRGPEDVVLYVGRATNLRSRVRSYFSDRLVANRGPLIVEVLEKAERIEVIETDSVLDAYILEASLIKKYQPAHNVVDKDNKSFQFVGVTKEDFPGCWWCGVASLSREFPMLFFLTLSDLFRAGHC